MSKARSRDGISSGLLSAVPPLTMPMPIGYPGASTSLETRRCRPNGRQVYRGHTTALYNLSINAPNVDLAHRIEELRPDP